jgi:hypothetical protein
MARVEDGAVGLPGGKQCMSMIDELMTWGGD